MITTLSPFLDPNSRFSKLKSRVEKAFETRPQDFQPLLDVLSPDSAYASGVAHTKRFLECWYADRGMREAMDTPAEKKYIEQYQLQSDKNEIRPLWDKNYFVEQSKSATWKPSIAVQRYNVWSNEKLLYLQRLRTEEISPSNVRLLAWRSRQVNRIFGHLGKNLWENIVHAPFATELSDGCSVGCWFCGVSADKRKQDWIYDQENQKLWHQILEVLLEKIGPAARHGFCYWATDPLDNPDYEKFCLDYANYLGRWPQTTTAQAHKYIERVRNLLVLSRKYKCSINRFSILSLGNFKKILKAFTAEELLHTELITQNMESNSILSNSGRARGSKRLEIKVQQTKGVREDWRDAPGTIACVSGFLINMVQKRVRLITPAPCSDRWPNGYWVYADKSFDTAESFRLIIDEMMDRHMPVSIDQNSIIRFRKDIQFEEIEGGFKLASWGSITTCKGSPNQTTIASLVHKGESTIAEIAIAIEKSSGVSLEQTKIFLNALFNKGLLDEEPDCTQKI